MEKSTRVILAAALSASAALGCSSEPEFKPIPLPGSGGPANSSIITPDPDGNTPQPQQVTSSPQTCRLGIETAYGQVLLLNHTQVACNPTSPGKRVGNHPDGQKVCLPIPRDPNFIPLSAPSAEDFRNDKLGVYYDHPVQFLSMQQGEAMRGTPRPLQFGENSSTHAQRISIDPTKVNTSIPGIGVVHSCIRTPRDKAIAQRADW